MIPTNDQARLKLFLKEYEIVCKRYSLIVYYDWGNEQVCERYVGTDDYLPEHLETLKEFGINK